VFSRFDLWRVCQICRVQRQKIQRYTEWLQAL